MDEEYAIRKAFFILKALYRWIGFTNSFICPLNNLLFGLSSNNLKILKSTNLPDDGEDELSVSFCDIWSSNANNLKLQILACLKSFAIISISIKILSWWVLCFLPVNDSWRDLVKNLAQKNTIFALIYQVVDEDTIDF